MDYISLRVMEKSMKSERVTRTFIFERRRRMRGGRGSKTLWSVLGIVLTLVLLLGMFPIAAYSSEMGCTNILCGKNATVDGSTIGTYTCDGALYAEIKTVPGEKHKPGSMMPIWYRPMPNNYAQYLEYLENPVLIGYIPQVRETYDYISIEVWYDDQRVGGINEYGVTTGETTISGRRELRNSKGLVYAYTNIREASLLTLALERAKTAREAIQVMGSLAEEYGYAQTGEHISVTDGNEAWAFEIFGPGGDWEPGCGKPGAVWCAQRIPDGHVGVSANRSRIGEIDLDDPDYFMASPNVKSLAFEMGWWDGTEPFIWYEAYGPSNSRGCQLREWRALSLVAPSLNLDSNALRYPFSVEPDQAVTVQDIIAIHRDTYEGTVFDLTEDPAWIVFGKKSPMANPHGPRDLHRLLGLSSERVIGTSSSVMSYVSQVHAGLPDPIKGCLWFGFGPPSTTCYVPIYSGVTELPKSWGETTLNGIGWEDAWWAFDLVEQLSYIKWQNTIADVKGVRDPAEVEFFDMQPEFENTVAQVYAKNGKNAARKYVNNYTNWCMKSVSDTYWQMADFLLFKYFFRGSAGAPQELPVVPAPLIEGNNRHQHQYQ